MAKTEGLTEKEVATIRDELDSCKRPLFFFHDDADGLCSFIQLYKYICEGKGVIVKARPRIDATFARKVEEYMPDKIFIVDIAIVDQEFIDSVKVPIIWIDHHDVLERTGVNYFNPRKRDKDNNIPASYLTYQINSSDIWIAMVGTVADWVLLDDMKEEFCKKYPDLLSADILKPDVALFDSDVGTLAKVFNFVLKGRTSEAMKCAKILTRIEHPHEILKQTTPRGKYIYRYYQKINQEYESILKDAVTQLEEQKSSNQQLMVYTYVSGKMSYSSELSNELLYRFPNSVLAIARENNGEMKISLRSPLDISMKDALAKSLFGIEGYGGGHEHACGACVRVEDWQQFLENLREEIKENKV